MPSCILRRKKAELLYEVFDRMVLCIADVFRIFIVRAGNDQDVEAREVGSGRFKADVGLDHWSLNRLDLIGFSGDSHGEALLAVVDCMQKGLDWRKEINEIYRGEGNDTCLDDRGHFD